MWEWNSTYSARTWNKHRVPNNQCFLLIRSFCHIPWLRRAWHRLMPGFWTQRRMCTALLLLSPIFMYLIWFSPQLGFNTTGDSAVIPTLETTIQPVTDYRIFITRSFLYRNDSLYSSEGSTLVSLFNMHLYADPKQLRPICSVYDETDEIKQQVPGKVMRLMDGLNLGDCKLAIYRVICPSLALPDDTTPNIGLSVRGSDPVHLTVTKADNKRRSLIICPGRMFAFDKWHLLVTALELYRAHWVDLVVVYIHSVDADIYKLITYYQRDGLVQIRPSLQMPRQVPGMDIDPNTETTFLHQLVNFQDCLYEFRESTEFIAFPDWDDLIMTYKFRPAPPIMRQAAADNPKTASFLLSRYVAVFPTLEEMTFFNTTTERLWRTDIYYENKPEAQVNGKAIVRPLLVESVGQHDAHYWRDGYTENPLDTNKLGLFAIHVREGCHPCTPIQSNQPSSKSLRTEIPIKDRIKLHNGELMQNNFQNFVDKYSLGSLMKKLPKKEQSVEHFNRCIDSMYEPAWKDIKRCRTYPQCTFPKIVHPCFNVKNKWENFFYDDIDVMISVMRDSSFEKEDECLV